MDKDRMNGVRFWLPRVGIALVLLVSVLIFTLPQRQPVWDGSVYWGMARFIATSGEQGIWEPLRPPLWPLLLTPFAALGVPATIALPLVGILLMIIGAVLLFKLAVALKMQQTQHRWLFLCFASAALLYAVPRGLSELPAIVALIAAALALAHKRPFVAGMLAACAFLTKFPLGLALVGFVAALLLARQWRAAAFFVAGWSLPAAVFLVTNIILYGDALLPLREGAAVFATAGLWLYAQPWWYYLQQLIEENILLLAAPLGAFLAFRRREPVTLGLGITGILTLVYLMLQPHQEERFFVLALPGLAILAAIALEHYKPTRAWYLALIIVVLQLVVGVALHASLDGKMDTRLVAADKSLHGDVLTSNPRPALWSDAKLAPLYYPVFGAHTKADIARYNAALISECDLACAPADAACVNNRDNIIQNIGNTMRNTATIESGGCVWQYFSVS